MADLTTGQISEDTTFEIGDDTTFEDVCSHYGADPDEVEAETGCRCPYAANGCILAWAAMEGLSSAEADALYAAC